MTCNVSEMLCPCMNQIEMRENNPPIVCRAWTLMPPFVPLAAQRHTLTTVATPAGGDR